MKRICITLSALIILSIPLLIASPAFAQINTSKSGDGCAPGKLCNPLKFDSIQQLIPALLDIVAQIGLIICTFFIILAGFKYVTAGGDTGKITAAHNILKWTVVGTAVLLGAKVLASILGNTVDQIIK